VLSFAAATPGVRDMADTARSFHLSDRLESALGLPVVALAALALGLVAAALWYAGALSEPMAAALIVIAVAVLATSSFVRPALAPGARGGTPLLYAAAAVTLLATAWGPLTTIWPGEPAFRGEAGVAGESIPVPPGSYGPVRLLVHGRLRDGGEPVVEFTLGGTRPPVVGRLERTYGYARVGRRGRTRVAHEHNAEWFTASIPEGTRALVLERVSGQLGGRMEIAAYRQVLPFPWAPVALALAGLVLAAAADARLALRGNAAVWAAMGLAFGLLVAFNATPFASLGPVVGGLILGATLGALGGWLASFVARKVVPAQVDGRRRSPAAGA
jgi:hypothetical protein